MLRRTTYLASINPFQRSKYGRGALLGVQSQYADQEKWQAELITQECIIHKQLWKGQGQFTLDSFLGQHRNAFVTMQECAQHVPYQLTNAQTRVTHLLDNIHCDNAPLQAAMRLVRNDMAYTGRVLAKMNDFEAAV